ncbi:hypothetical protein J1N35_033884 [Gossypium stocksii]|uniref:Uncharacterized protein n=1 Tax=Gossypium stocksii TaxID=47602 RepID=A0A9D3USY4_9ROSI|nr:hypothetical protein J1N35_033884 [Gossypium stocksii]
MTLLLLKRGRYIVFTTVEAWKHFNFLCRNYILNGFSDALYEVYSIKKTSKEFQWTINTNLKMLELKSFLVAKFLNFVTIDSQLVVNQVQELQLIIHGILAKGMLISESFQVVAIIEKLSIAWNDFKNYLKHRRKEMSMEDLIVRLRVEEDKRGMEKWLNKVANENGARANVVEVKKDFNKGNNLRMGLNWDQKVAFPRSKNFKENTSIATRWGTSHLTVGS